jgi:hypothetical protein
MAQLVDGSIMEAVQAATSIHFDQDEEAKDRLWLPARMKGGDIKRLEDVRYPTLWGHYWTLCRDALTKRRTTENREGLLLEATNGRHPRKSVRYGGSSK